LVAVTIALLALGVRGYRAHVVYSAYEYAPQAAYNAIAPPETEIPVVLTGDVSLSTERGALLMGLVSQPIMVHGEIAIPPTGYLRGVVEEIEVKGNEAWVQLHFNNIVYKNQVFRIHTAPVKVVIPIRDDLEIVARALDVTAEAAVGTAIGAASGDAVATAFGLVTGAAGAGLKSSRDARIVVVRLTQSLRLPA
jgi:hypothetical protein